MTKTQSPGDPGRSEVMRGILLVSAAVLVFALADVITKHLASLYGVPLVVAARYLVNLALLLAVLLPRHGGLVLRTNRTGLVLLRAGCLAVASLCMGLALQRMPVGETVAIIYLSPFLVMGLAVWLLGERVNLAGWTGAALGFAGVLLIVRPGAGLVPAGVGFALLAAAASAGYNLLSRSLARTETTAALLIITASVGTGVFCALLPLDWRGVWPSGWDAGLILALGALSTLGHVLFTAAYRCAPASVLAPVNYLHLVWAGGLGWLVFGHLPDGISLLGMGLVAGSGALVALTAQRPRS